MEFKKILAVRDDRMGDFILTLPAIRALQKAFPSAHLTVVVSESVFPLAVRVLPQCNIFCKSSLFSEFYSFLHKEKFDLVVFFKPRLGTAVATFLAGVSKRLGTGYRGYSFLYNLRHYEHRHNAERHEAEYSLSLLETLEINKSLRFETVSMDETEIRKVSKKLAVDFSKNWIAIHPGSGGSAPNWSKENYIGLARMLTAEGFSILWTGSLDELRGMESVGIPLAGKTEVWDLACLYSKCKLIIGPSTGPLHLASLVGAPAVGLYSPIRVTSPRRWGPLGPKVKVLTPPVEECQCASRHCKKGNCMELLSVEEVFRTVLDILKESSEPAQARLPL